MPFDNPRQEREIRKEGRRFGEQSILLVNAILNRWFDLKPSSAHGRLLRIAILLMLAGFAISLRPHPWNEWQIRLQQFFVALLASHDQLATLNSILELINLGLRAQFNPYVLWYVPAFFLPIFIAYQAASFYLADIFDLEHIRIARKFVRQVALTGSKDVIHITGGDLASEDQTSPIFKIGGPGKVIVSLNSVALFEKADGRPHVIGPTEKEPKRKATLDGFERFRQAFDLRDHFIDLREDNGTNSAVKSRSLDGIPVALTDVRLMFSVYRGRQESTPEMPYPYAKEAIEQQVYKSTSKVTPHLSDPSKFDFNFESSMLSMVRRELSSFMSQKNLTEYLANISRREVNKAEENENLILEAARSVLEPLESAGEAKKGPPVPRFTPRREITDLFSQFTKKFTDDVQDKGIELHWIGVGTWDIPLELVAEKHLDAWKMSRENIHLNSDAAMGKASNDARVQKILSMIQSVPLEVYEEKIRNIVDRNAAVRMLSFEYQKQFDDNYDSLHNNKKRIPPTLVAAISLIRRGSARFVPPPPPRVPPTPREHELYAKLMKKIGFYDAVERLIMLELEKNPQMRREDALETINKDWDLDIEGKWRS